MSAEIELRNELVLVYVDNDTPLKDLLSGSITRAEFWSQPNFQIIPTTRLNTIVSVSGEERLRRAELYEIFEWFDVTFVRKLENDDAYIIIEFLNQERVFLFFPQNLGYQLSHIAFEDELYVGKRIYVSAGTEVNGLIMEHDMVFDYSVLLQDFLNRD